MFDVVCFACFVWSGIADRLASYGKSCRSFVQALQCSGKEMSTHGDFLLSLGGDAEMQTSLRFYCVYERCVRWKRIRDTMDA